MNVDTGHLIYMRDGEQAPEGYHEVPRSLADEIKRTMGDKIETYIDLNQPSKLSHWAKQKRNKRNKMAKKSRKANRRA